MRTSEAHPSASLHAQAERLGTLLAERQTCVLTGAGCSTESGIPDYRGPQTRQRAKNPIQYRQFMDDPATRRRYWARSMVGWPKLASAEPNPAHLALSELERKGRARGLITQNVDRLHRRAGSQRVIELHGSLYEVRCVQCRFEESRDSVQTRLLELNPEFRAQAIEIAPDGDAELTQARIEHFVIADCLECGGVLKPDVVFFGENVPRPKVEAAYAMLEESEALLVVGSSLAVFSGYRFVRRAKDLGRPIAILNLGSSRGDPYADLLIDGAAGEILPTVIAGIG